MQISQTTSIETVVLVSAVNAVCVLFLIRHLNWHLTDIFKSIWSQPKLNPAKVKSNSNPNQTRPNQNKLQRSKSLLMPLKNGFFNPKPGPLKCCFVLEGTIRLPDVQDSSTQRFACHSLTLCMCAVFYNLTCVVCTYGSHLKILFFHEVFSSACFFKLS